MIEIMEREGGYYIFTDVAEMFWPGTWENGNHEAEARIQERMEQEGCCHVPGSLDWETPDGLIAFDSESGCFECHASALEPVEYVKAVIEKMLAERAAHREALR